MQNGETEPAAAKTSRVFAASNLFSVGAELEQGDILSSVDFVATRSPLAYVKPKTLKGDLPGWEETAIATLHPKEHKRCVVAYLATAHGVVISHGCDIDKPKNDGRPTTKQRILVAPVRPLQDLPNDQQIEVRNQLRRSAMMLPGIPTLGDHYADLRLISPIPRPLIDSGARVASMTPQAILRLQAQVESFLFRAA